MPQLPHRGAMEYIYLVISTLNVGVELMIPRSKLSQPDAPTMEYFKNLRETAILIICQILHDHQLEIFLNLRIFAKLFLSPLLL